MTLPSTASLMPQRHPLGGGQTLYTLHSDATSLVRIDLIREAGTAYQRHPLVAAATERLYAKASGKHEARWVAEFLDYRGAVLEHHVDVLTSTTTCYCLRRYLDEMLDLVDELLADPLFPTDELDAYRPRRKQELRQARQRTADEARRLFYQALFGEEHPLGRYADASDADRLSRDMLTQHYAERYGRMDIIASGLIDEGTIAALGDLGRRHGSGGSPVVGMDLPPVAALLTSGKRSIAIPTAVQTSLRVGRVVPLRWDDPDYARFLLLVTILGGYFGSRLMSNLREEKGYTYGIYARTQIYRGVIVFYIAAEVAGGTADAAEQEIRHELQRLVDEPVSDEELALIKRVMIGDFVRSVDGVFERAERLGNMLSARIDERFTDNLRQALAECTPTQLQGVAGRLLNPDAMVYCRAGVV